MSKLMRMQILIINCQKALLALNKDFQNLIFSKNKID